MGGLSIWHLLLLGFVATVLFGKGKISGMMEELGQGIKSFKKGIADEEASAMKPVTRIEGQAAPAPQPVEMPAAQTTTVSGEPK